MTIGSRRRRSSISTLRSELTRTRPEITSCSAGIVDVEIPASLAARMMRRTTVPRALGRDDDLVDSKTMDQ